jgi:hypothetical protein
MNKGIEKVTGEWINFMNSGDWFYDENVIELFICKLPNSIDVFYGDTLLNFRQNKFREGPLAFNNIHKYMPFHHQSCFTRTNLLIRTNFDLKYKICADYNFFYNTYQKGGIFFYEPMIISVFESENGISAKNVLESFKERIQIIGKENSVIWKIKFRLFQCRKLLKNFIPNSLLILYRKKMNSDMLFTTKHIKN